MGTRNVTIIKFDGEEKVRQYGQWDGCPVTALASIVKFLKTNGAIEHLEENLVKCKLVSEERFVYPDNFSSIGNTIYKNWMSFHRKTYERCIAELVDRDICDKEEALQYYLATRDTGYHIPELLITSAADEATKIVLQRAYTDAVDWQIEAVNIIDLDHERIISYWHGKRGEWCFNSLPDEKEIEDFESGEE